ncbi:MAG: T9SS type A sorting domain-containing protein [Bacteroidales bacterium]
MEALGNENEPVTFTINDTTGYTSGSFTGWGGIFFDGMNSNLTENSVFTYCNIEYSGSSAITCVDYDHLMINNCILRNNQGSGISLYEDSNIGIENISITQNGYVGFACNNSSPLVDGFEINNNDGSGIYCSGIGSTGSLINFINGKVLNNVSENNGGGITLADGAGASFDNVQIAYNEGVNGGGVYCHMSTVEMNNVSINDNFAVNGGGIYSSYYADLSIEYTLISGNHATEDGAGIYSMESTINTINATISDNFAGGQGGGIFHFDFDASTQTIRNSILWANTPDEIFSMIEKPVVTFSNVMGGFEGAGNIDGDPMFENPFSNNYHLQWSNFPDDFGLKSACIDMGDPIASYDPDGTVADMGAFFFDQAYITSIKENAISNEVRIYPNPVKNRLNVENSENYFLISVFTLTGEKVTENEIHNAFVDIDVSGLNTGFYTLVLHSKDGNLVAKKFIKQ